MDSNETYEFENRRYVSPTISSGEQEAFVDTLRNIQQQNAQQISEDTYNLGTQVPSNLGGLGGGEAYFSSRYQIPQVNEMVDTLKSAAQAQVLNDIMKNYQAQLKERYNQAYRRAKKRKRASDAAAAKLPSNSGNTPQGQVKTSATQTEIDPKVDELALRNFTGKTKMDVMMQNVRDSQDKLKQKAAQEAAQAKANRSWLRNTLVTPFEPLYNSLFGGDGKDSSGGGSW